MVAAHSYSAVPGGVEFSVLVDQLNIMPLAIWSGLGGAWLLVGAALLALLSQKRYRAALAFAGALVVMVGGALLVVDVTRSMAYCLPAVFVALSVLSRSEPHQRLERLTAISAAVSLVVPTFYIEGSAGVWWLYPLPVQLGRWISLL